MPPSMVGNWRYCQLQTIKGATMYSISDVSNELRLSIDEIRMILMDVRLGKLRSHQ